MEESGVVRLDASEDKPFQDNSTLQRELMDSKELERAKKFGKVNDKESIIRRTKDGPLQKTPIKPKSDVKQPLKSEELPVFLKKELDVLYVSKILKELKDNTLQYAEREEILEEYKRLTMYAMRQLEGGGQVRKLDPEQKAEVIREVNRVFAAKFEKAGPFKEFTQRLVKYRMEDLRREVKENQWKIHLRFLGEMLRMNPKNKDLLEKIRLKALLNPKIEEEYGSLLRKDRILTVSQFEMNILKEVTAFAYKYTSQELFDTGMLNAMKVILSYVERKTDIIISDYHYLLAIPLLVAFSEERWMLGQPTELIGFYFSILDIVKFLDPAGGLR